MIEIPCVRIDRLRDVLACLAFVTSIGLSHAQSPCGTIQTGAPFISYPQPAVEIDRGGPPAYLIPTVLHIHYGGLVPPLGVLHANAVIDSCNRDLRGMNADLADVIPGFASITGDAGIELRLATIDGQGQCMSGIQYHYYDPEQQQPQLAAHTYNTRDYMNIHVFPAQNSFAVLPGAVSAPVDMSDVIVLSAYDAVFRPRSLAHEVGHWAGLYHTFGNINTSGVACGDDYIADTPETAGSVVGTCDLTLANCNTGVTENVQNMMDYSSCPLMFTQGQAQHMVAVLNDTTRVRCAIHQPANLQATGVTNPATCAMTGAIWTRQFQHCGGTEVWFRAMAEGRVPDSLRWTFTGGSPATSVVDNPTVTYASSGTYPVQLMLCHQGNCITVQQNVQVIVPTANANGLPMVANIPFSEDFENGFSFPRPNMLLVDDGTPTWQPFSGAGYASSHCLYVPAEAVTAADTCLFRIGNFDLSTLTQPAVRFKIAASLYPTSSFATLDVMFRDQCSNIFSGDVWYVAQLYEWATDHGMNYVPASDAEWYTVFATFPVWNMAESAEFGIRLRRPAVPGGFTPEPFYLDDLYIGEADTFAGLAEEGGGGMLLVAPNPARDQALVHRTTHGSPATLRVFDATGRELMQLPFGGTRLQLYLTGLPAGVLLVAVESAEGRSVARLVVERN